MPITIKKSRQIYDEAGIAYTIGNLIYEVPNGPKIYGLIGNVDKVYVETSDIHANRHVIRRMSNVIGNKINLTAKPGFEKMLWPEKLVKGENDKGFTGFVANNPHIQGDLHTLLETLEERKEKRVLSPVEKNYYLNLGIQLATIIALIHECGYVVGLLSPDKFWVSKEGNIYSCITYQFSFENINAFDNPYYVTPEWLISMNRKNVIFDQKSDSFLYAIILFQLLTGEYPFLTERNISEVEKEELWEQMVDGKSLYFWEDTTIIEKIKQSLIELPSRLECLFEKTFDYCGYGAYDEPRASIEEWLVALREH